MRTLALVVIGLVLAALTVAYLLTRVDLSDHFVQDALTTAALRLHQEHREHPEEICQASLHQVLIQHHNASVSPIWFDDDGNPVDAWGTPFRVTHDQAPPVSWVLCGSAGPDQEFGTSDDISYRSEDRVASEAEEHLRDEASWLTNRPANAHAYADETLARFGKLVEGDDWRDAAWSAQGMLEAVHEKTGLTFVLVPGGEFTMGAREGEGQRLGDVPQVYDEELHRVSVATFLLGTTECTQEAWDRVGGDDERGHKGRGLPIEGVNRYDAQSMCRKAGLRLPSESEWEYACRAGTTTAFWSGDFSADLTRVAWRGRSSGRRAHVVGEKGQPNPWGLHDMHGNVDEWCEDWYRKSYAMTPADGSANTYSRSGYCVSRGGGWHTSAFWSRSASRGRVVASVRRSDLGFRPAADLPE
jgi:formylglycine-generating enzyme required for sulfatase activity